jgi:hypothetical protein
MAAFQGNVYFTVQEKDSSTIVMNLTFRPLFAFYIILGRCLEYLSYFKRLRFRETFPIIHGTMMLDVIH